MAFGARTNCLSNFPPSTGQKWKNFIFFFDILTIHNDETSYVKHVLDPLCVFFRPPGMPIPAPGSWGRARPSSCGARSPAARGVTRGTTYAVPCRDRRRRRQCDSARASHRDRRDGRGSRRSPKTWSAGQQPSVGRMAQGTSPGQNWPWTARCSWAEPCRRLLTISCRGCASR